MFNYKNPHTKDDFHIDKTGMPICDRCNGEMGKRLKVGGMVMIMDALCECRSKEFEEEQRLLRETERLSNIVSLREKGIGDELYRKHRFDKDDSSNTKESKLARRYVEKWQEFYDEGIGIIFTGEIGSGKSFYAACIANALIDQEVVTIMTSFDRILNEAAGLDDRNKILKRLRECDLLVIDDLGIERQSDYGLEIVYGVINDRVKSGKPLIITTNMPVSDMQSENDLRLSRIYDRILFMCPIQVVMTGESRRKEAHKKRIEKVKGILKG